MDTINDPLTDLIPTQPYTADALPLYTKTYQTPALKVANNTAHILLIVLGVLVVFYVLKK